MEGKGLPAPRREWGSKEADSGARDVDEGKHGDSAVADASADSAFAGDASPSGAREGVGGAAGGTLRDSMTGGSIMVSSDPRARAVLDGFRLKYMCMRDAVSGAMMWESAEWDESMFYHEQEAHVPRSILSCAAVSREIKFSSRELMEDFRLEQRVFFQGVCLEEWRFRFGFVIPGSTNTWQQTIEAADEADMLPADLISGKITIESSFFDGDLLVSKSLVRVFYD